MVKLQQKTKRPLKFLGSGKVKDLYEYDDDSLLFKFSDRVSAYDVKFKEDIPKKGNVLCRFAEFWFEELGAFEKEENIQYFKNFCILVFKKFSSKVPYFITINEPSVYAYEAYSASKFLQ